MDGFMSLVVSVIPILMFIVIIIFVIRIIRRMERRSEERLKLEKENAAMLREQIQDLNIRLTRIENILKEVD